MTLHELESLLQTTDFELLFLYISPSSEKPIRHWWSQQGYEPYQHPVAEKEPFPSQADVFWALVDDLGRPPTQEEFGRKFFLVYKSYNKWSYLFEDQWGAWGVEARVRRTYPSFIREYHVEYLLKEVFGDDCVDSARCLDYSGVDFIVKVGRDWYPIRTYVDSKRSRDFAADKAKHRHSGLGDVFDLVLPLNASYRVGQYRLYSREQVENLKGQICERVGTD